jgi:anaerobic selenocysteine-containing dehydrogenase
MGGREVGGLANMLAAHMGFSAEERDRVRRFWQAPNVVAGEGLKAVAMFDAIVEGRIKALWVMGTNPAVSLPRAGAVAEALAKLELFVVSENVRSNDTLRWAQVRLPAAAWGEKDGTVTNSERRISRQRPFLPLAGEARPDWWILSEVARRLGYGEAFAPRPRYSTSTRACRASRMAASAPSTSPGRQVSASTPMTASSPSSGRSAMDMARAIVCLPREDSSRRIGRPGSLPSRPPASPTMSRTTGRSCSTPAAFATSGTR